MTFLILSFTLRTTLLLSLSPTSNSLLLDNESHELACDLYYVCCYTHDSMMVDHQQIENGKQNNRCMNRLREWQLESESAKAIDNFLNQSITWSIIAIILTIYALFIDDLRLLYFSKTSDKLCSIINWIILVIFLLEWLLDSIVRPEYVNSLTGALDLLAALSLVPATEFLQDETSVARIARTFRALRILRATRAAAMALKTEASVKRVKSARELNKLIRQQQKNQKAGGMEDAIKVTRNKSLLEATLLERSNVKMLLGVLVLLLGTSLIDYTETDRVGRSGLELVEIYARKNLTALEELNVMHQYQQGIEYDSDGTFMNRRLIYLAFDGRVINASKDYTNLMLVRRNTEIDVIRSRSGNVVAKIDMKDLYDLMNWMSMILTIFSIIVIVFWANSFRQDYSVFVLKPLNRMLDVLKLMTDSPLIAIQKSEEFHNRTRGNGSKHKNEMELIEACIGKFGMLLKVGFGEAGMDIISKNLGNGIFDPVTPGIKVLAIFGICDIREFTFCCCELEERTMVFTNLIAKLVHQHIDHSGGVVNRNLGDAFVAVWKVELAKSSDLCSDTSDDERHSWAPSLGEESSLPKSIPLRRASSLMSSSVTKQRRGSFKNNVSGNTRSSESVLVHINVDTNQDINRPKQKRMSFGTKDALIEMNSKQVAIAENGEESDIGYARNAANSPQHARIASVNNQVPGIWLQSTILGSEKEDQQYIHSKLNTSDVMDQALIAFLKIRTDMKENEELLEHRTVNRLQLKRPNYHVRLAYSLHVGWAIEGAIGSSLKVDASYVSPHVNLCQKLQEAGKQFDVQLLMSDVFVQNIQARQLNVECRPVDVVFVKGFDKPITLYTYQPPEYPESMSALDKEKFIDNWLRGFDLYVDGKWKECKPLIEECLLISNGTDGPSKMLLRTIQDKELKKTWKGARELVSLAVEAKKAQKIAKTSLHQLTSTVALHANEKRKREEPLTDSERALVMKHLEDTENGRNGSSSSSNSSKFVSSEALVSGSMQHAKMGLRKYLCVGKEKVQTIMKNGEQAIITEINQLGDTEVIGMLNYILNEPCSEKSYPNGIRDKGRSPTMHLIDFVQDENAVGAGLERAHVIALRLYTTLAYKSINDPLRDQERFKNKEIHPLPATVIFLRDALLKLRVIVDDMEEKTQSIVVDTHKVFWRGIRKVHLTEDFIKNGGTELAPMSTTSSLKVALQYGNSDVGVLFRIKVPDALTHGADLRWISVFPGDEEILYPPFTFLRPTERKIQQVIGSKGQSLTIIEVSPDLSAGE